MRLFVGIDTPPSIAERLVSAQPPAAPGVRNVLSPDFHLTLHFLGDMDADAVAAALVKVDGRQASIRVRGLGQFLMPGGRRILWAGVDATDRLIELKDAVADALAGAGYVPERRRYRPHITLARVANAAAGSNIDALVAAGENLEIGEFDAPAFHLYDTAPPEAPHRYRRIRTYELAD